MSSSNRVLEAPAGIVARRAELQVSSLTGELVAELERFLADLPDRYETTGPLILAPELVDARRLVQQLLARNQRLKQRARLFELAGQLSGQLSYMAVNLGNFSVAQAYGAEAFELARFIGHDELSAWIRGTQSLAAYYTGNHQRALDLAQDGQCYAKGGLQAVRLAVNGEARALGKLQDQRGAAVAVTSARTASNAATAYLALGQTKQVLDYAQRAREIVDASPSQWSYALIRLDMAMALLNLEHPEPEGASALGAEAVAAARHLRIESIQQRTRELVAALRSWRHLPTVANFLDDASSWLATKWYGTAAP
jgi:tetratricopeptide (TPR) repeat protein